LSVVDLKVQDDLTVTDDVAIGGLATVGGTLGVTGVVTANAGVVVDNITIDGTEIDLSSGDLTLDVAGDIILDADGGDVFLKDGGTEYARFTQVSGGLRIQTVAQDTDIVFRGNDNGGDVDALTLDMSDAGTAIFNHDIKLADGNIARFGTGADLQVYHNGSHAFFDNTTGDTNLQGVGDVYVDAGADLIFDAAGSDFLFKKDAALMFSIRENASNIRLKSEVSDKDMLFMGNDGGVEITALTLDMSAAGSATFNHDVILPSAGNLSFTSGGFNPRISNSNSDTALSFFTNNTERFQIATDGGLHVLTPGTSNVRLGVNAGDSIASGGNYNVCIGDEAGTAISTGDNNIAIGFRALKSEDGNGSNIAIGGDALENLNAGADGYNVAVGANAGNDLTDGVRNVIIGGIAGDQATTIDDCVIIGYNAGGNATMTGHDNVLVGKDAGQELAAGHSNVIVGRDAGQASSTAFQNVFIGEDAGFTNVGGDANTFVGSDSGFLNTGDGNTYIGKNAGESMTSGSENTILGSYDGDEDGLDIRTGSNNIVLSDGVGEVSYFKNASGNTFIGNATIDPTATLEVRGSNPTTIRASGGSNTNNKVEIGYDSGSGKGAYIKAGSSGINTLQVYVDNTSLAAEFKGNGDFYSNDGTVHSLSDSRVKKDIADLTDGLDIVKQLKPRTFKFNGKATTLDDNRTKYGFIADEVMTVAPQYVSVDTQTIDDAEVDDFKSLSTTKMIPMLVKAIQELEARIATLEG